MAEKKCIHSESPIIRRIGLDVSNDTVKNYSCALNRIVPVNQILFDFIVIIYFIQFLSIGLAGTIGGFTKNFQNIKFFDSFFAIFIHPALYTSDPEKFNEGVLIAMLCIHAIWFLLYIAFGYQFSRTNEASPFIVLSLYYVGYVFLIVVMPTFFSTVGFYIKCLYFKTDGFDTVLITLALLEGNFSLIIHLFMVNIITSSPDICVQDKLCIWPHEINEKKYRTLLLSVLSFMIELIRETKCPQFIPYIFIMIVGIAFLFITWKYNVTVLPRGRKIIFGMYLAMFLTAFLSFIYYFVNEKSFVFLIVFIVLYVGILIAFIYLLNARNKKLIDIMYLKYENIIGSIDTPQKCIDFIHTGLIFNAPCIANHSLISWAEMRFPFEQELLLAIGHVSFLLNYSRETVLQVIGNAVEIKPLSRFYKMMYYQMFKKLPAAEYALSKRIEIVKTKYKIPLQTLRSFWEKIYFHQWDEAIMRCNNFTEDIRKMESMFSNMLFENPSSKVILNEYANFASTIQGNYIASCSALQEIENIRFREKIQMEDTTTATATTTTINTASLKEIRSRHQHSNSSSFNSSLLSTNNQTEVILPNIRIQEAFMARPLYWPNIFFVLCAAISVISTIFVLVVFFTTREYRNTSGKRIELSETFCKISLRFSQSLLIGSIFNTHGEEVQNTVTGTPFVQKAYSQALNDIMQAVDQYMYDCFSLTRYMPTEFLDKWTNMFVETNDSLPDMIAADKDDYKEVESSLITVYRMYQVRVMTLAHAPLTYLGSVTSPSPEAILMALLYPSVAETTINLQSGIKTEITNDMSTYNLLFYMLIGTSAAIIFLLTCIAIPFVCLGFMHEYDFFVTLMQSISQKVSSKMIQKVTEISNNSLRFDDRFVLAQNTKISKSHYKIHRIPIIFLASFVVSLIPIAIMFIAYMQYSDKIAWLAEALELSAEFIGEFGSFYLHAFRIVSGFPSPYSQEEEIDLLNKSGTASVMKYRDLYFGGTDSIKEGVISKCPDKVSEINKEKCTTIAGSGKLNVNCMTLSDILFFLYDQISMICSVTTASLPKSFNSSWWRMFYPIATFALNNRTVEFYTIIDSFFTDAKQQMKYLSTMSITLSFIILVAHCIGAYYYKKLHMTEQIMSLMRPMFSISPELLMDSSYIMKFLHGDYDTLKRILQKDACNKKDNLSHSLIDFIEEGVIIVNPDGIITATNKKIHDIINFSTDDMIGMNIEKLLPASCMQLFDILAKVRTKQTYKQSTTIGTTLLDEERNEIYVRITLVIQDVGDNKTPACAFIFNEKNEMIKAQESLRKEKEKIEMLLDSILPRTIAVSLLNEKEEISFETSVGIVLFSDLVSFTPMCSKMSSKMIMFVLNLLFTSYDKELANYKRLTKLKTIGDAYVCASGMFEGDGPLEEAAKEMVSFGISMQKIIPKLNKEHNLTLKQRIGIHCGGPLICGVLGKEKPLFEVIGKAVELAESFESKCLPEKILVSQEIADLVKANMTLKLSERDAVIEGYEKKCYTIE